jgi:hypothetical protein
VKIQTVLQHLAQQHQTIDVQPLLQLPMGHGHGVLTAQPVHHGGEPRA